MGLRHLEGLKDPPRGTGQPAVGSEDADDGILKSVSRFEPPETTFVKGVGLNSAMEYAERELGLSEVAKGLEGLRAEHGDFDHHRISNALVPLPAAAAAWMMANQMHGGTLAQRRDFFQRMGVHIADSNLRGVYKTLMAFMVKPERLAKHIPGLWKTYFRGLTVELDLSELSRGIARCSTVGFGGAPHIGEMAEGWLKYAFELCGAKKVSCYEESLELGAEAPDHKMIFTIRWKPQD